MSNHSWAGKHERRIDNMIYLILSHFLQVLFSFCCAISTFSATPYMLSSTVMRGKVKSSEMTDVDRPCINKDLRPTSFCYLT